MKLVLLTFAMAALAQQPDEALWRAGTAAREAGEFGKCKDAFTRLAAAQLGLSINGSAQVSRQRMSDHGLIPSKFLGFSWYNQADLGVQLDYDFDWQVMPAAQGRSSN